ncbi:Haloacid dehalogenase-like hydrolase (HAD) superfamily protein [Raphanus sativus]|nr:Haloacid dehalogenase-like hydrolase (HAD) superfamily protein [Raphanus sativus]
MPGVRYDFMVMVKTESGVMPIFVVKRPGLTEFLERLGESFQVVVFTAGLEDYASQVLEQDRQERCDLAAAVPRLVQRSEGKICEGLSMVVGEDLGSALIVDDPSSYSLQPENGVPIKAFVTT